MGLYCMNMRIELHFCLVIIVGAVSVVQSSGALRELPGEDDNFEDIRTKNKVYVDKSEYITKLLERDNRFLRLCRPPRFGKSNFLQMLSSFFRGKKDLFEGLAIYANHDWGTTYPVLYLDFGAMNVRTLLDFEADLCRAITESGKSYGLDIPSTASAKSQLWQFLYELSEKRGQPRSVVVLVNEYDWPVRRHVEKGDEATSREMKHFLNDLFVLFRVRRDDVKLLFLGCTTKLQLTDLDGGSNPLEDITYQAEFNGMIGLTENELTDSFKAHIDAMVVRQPNQTFDSLVRKLRQRYNGYCFSRNTSRACRLFNFRSVISCLREQRADVTYWRPDSMIDEYRTRERENGTIFRINTFREAVVFRHELERAYNFDEEIPPKICLILQGYLTFRRYDRLTDWFVVGFPNEEARESFKKEMLACLPGGDLMPGEISEKCDRIERAMSEGKCQEFINLVNSIAFSSADVFNLTDGRKVKEFEHKLIDRVVRVLEACNMEARYRYEFRHAGGSVVAGILQLLVELPDQSAYAFEFERKKSAVDAFTRLLEYVKRKAFQGEFEDRRIHLMGVRLGKKGGTIDEWIRVTYLNGNCSDLRASSPSFKKTFDKVTKTPCNTS